MKRFLAFLAIGSAFAAVEEFLTVVVLKRDVPSYIFTLLVLFPIFLSLVYFIGRKVVDRFVRNGPARDVAHFFLFGSVGLLLEWTLMGLAPWSNPDANPLAMLLFQLGLFAFWGTVATAPRVFLDTRESSRRTRREVLRFVVPYAALTYAAAFATPPRDRFSVLIPLIILGFLVITVLLLWRPLRELSEGFTVRRQSRGSTTG